MSCPSCGDTACCGCCEGIHALTPVSEYNRPGLDALSYRAGTHGSFFQTMLARLPGASVEIRDAGGAVAGIARPLEGLTTRDPGDPAIALLDAWACVADVLTFYQERIANEGFLRTATERRSVLELARLVGYRLRPGVAASVFLAYTVDDKQLDSVEIPAGAKAQSIPGPDELPQTFETSESLMARASWNNLQVRIGRPQLVTLDNALQLARLYASGANLQLAAGDLLLLSFSDDGSTSVLRTVAGAEANFAEGRTEIALQPAPPLVAAVVPLLAQLVRDMAPLVTATSPGPGRRALEQAKAILAAQYLALYSEPTLWAKQIAGREGALDPRLQQLIAAFAADVANRAGSPGPAPGPAATDPAHFVERLLVPARPQPANSLQLARSRASSFGPGADAHAQLLLRFAPQIRDSFYTAWAGAAVNASVPALQSVQALRLKLPLFGAASPRQPTYDANHELKRQSDWEEWPVAEDEAGDSAFLDQGYDSILPDSLVLMQGASGGTVKRAVYRVKAAATVQRTAYGVSGKSTRLGFDRDWWSPGDDGMPTLRATLAVAGGETLALVDEPLAGEVQGQEIELAGLHQELVSGRWLVLSGERADIPGVSGVRGSELMMVSGLRHGYDPALPGDLTHTTLLLATPTAYSYKRATVVIQANVVKATHGETRNETLGSGNGAALQKFMLKQPPLTFVSAPTPDGAASTLQVRVDDLAWTEADTLAGAGPNQHAFVTRTGDDDRVVLTFGNGEQGARVPSGIENVRATYRQGIGMAGNVRAGQVSLLLSRPLGVNGVLNPLRASGGADREDLGQARANAPLAVMALDRLVSTRDYADFARTFAGIAKASARRLSDGHRLLVHLTVAGAADAPIDASSDLYRNLSIALGRFGDPALPVRLAPRELVVLMLSAEIALASGYAWEPTALRVRQALLAQMGFERRALGQPALLCEVLSLIQNTEGVAWVNIGVFGGIPEKRTDDKGKRRLLTLDELAATVRDMNGAAARVDARVAAFENGALLPAQLAIFTTAVADTIILNQTMQAKP